MKKNDQKNIIIILATLITSILSLGIFNLQFQLIFIVIFIIICCLGFSYINYKSKMKKVLLILLSSVEVIILCFSIINKGSLLGFYDHIKKFFVSPYEASSENVVALNMDFESYFNGLSSQLESIDEKMEDTKSNIEDLDNSVNIITYNLENVHYNVNIDEIEIAEISELIETEFGARSKAFPNMNTDIYAVELLYKAFISEKPYYYCNILEAFNRYGINTDKLHISENILFIWDIERLYMTYNMKNSIANELESDEIFEERIFLYNDYKVNLNKFSDTFDYGNWRRYFEKITPKQIDEALNTSIMSLYKKFVINLSTE